MESEDEWMNRVPSWVVAVLGVALSAFFLWSFGGGYLERRARRMNPRYTIGYVTGTSYVVSASSHSVAFFTYTAGGQTYRTSSPGDLADGCTRCLVKYAADDPQNFEFYHRVCVPDSIAEAPKPGWRRPPFPVPDDVE